MAGISGVKNSDPFWGIFFGYFFLPAD